jgi:hypothetical protein
VPAPEELLLAVRDQEIQRTVEDRHEFAAASHASHQLLSLS